MENTKKYYDFLNINNRSEPVRIGIALTLLGYSEKLLEPTSNATWIDGLINLNRNKLGSAKLINGEWKVNNTWNYTADPIKDRRGLLKGMQLAGRIKTKWTCTSFYIADGGFVIDTQEEGLVYIRTTPKKQDISNDAISGLNIAANFTTEFNQLTFHWIEVFKKYLKPGILEIEWPQNWVELQTKKLGHTGIEIGGLRFFKLNKLLAYLWKERKKYFTSPRGAEYKWAKARKEIYENIIIEEWFQSLTVQDNFKSIIEKAEMDLTYWLVTPESLKLMGPMPNGEPRSGDWITKKTVIDSTKIAISIGFSGEMCGPLKYKISII